MRTAILLAAAVALTACNDANAPVVPMRGSAACIPGKVCTPVMTIPARGPDLPMTSAYWAFANSPNMPANPSNIAGGGIQLTFPNVDGPNYLLAVPKSIVPTSSISADVSVQITGNPTFDYRTAPNNTCISPAKAHLFIQRAGDNYSGAGSYEFYRYWNNTEQGAYVLAGGSATISGDLTNLSDWIDVDGVIAEKNPLAFKAALSDLGYVGITFGGGCFYGHGVFVDPKTGTATFTVSRFSLR